MDILSFHELIFGACVKWVISVLEQIKKKHDCMAFCYYINLRKNIPFAM